MKITESTVSADPIVVIMGPTASGKSALALELARKRGGEIVSVDSMQLYRGLEIGTAQPTAEEQMEIPHHLVGCFDFHERIDVFMFQRLADAAIAEIRRRGRLPVLAGGTGLYLRALLYGLDDLPADPGLRQELDAAYDSEAGETALKRRMAELDPAGLARWENCRRRLIRALEVRLLTGKSILELQKNPFDRLRYPVRAWRLDPEPEVLRERIARRARRMLETGWIEEAERAIASGLLETPTAHQALGYRLIAEHLAGRFDFEELHARISTATWQLARRQRTWFRHQHPEAEPLRSGASVPETA
ncbi:MAG TPA: tRNA (adenosine(37)-N6)-dimethylallyltransferase MiaA [Lentisphaeria bacterium]|nr:tRNA (adenosine(37)-N6)-dimethylallyltransferase MiaA [Lentisphaeria bacterium]HCH84632.1 tRNA (adenosine(37)-N6)-dimethylallyltransferase MiaA [Lentisphaeria bacterium]